MENNLAALTYSLGFLFLFIIVYVVMEALPTRAPPEPLPDTLTLVFADGNHYELAHGTKLWVYAGCVWQEANAMDFEGAITLVAFYSEERGYSKKRYSCGSWRLMPFDEIQPPNFIPVNPRRDAAKPKTIGEFYGH